MGKLLQNGAAAVVGLGALGAGLFLYVDSMKPPPLPPAAGASDLTIRAHPAARMVSEQVLTWMTELLDGAVSVGANKEGLKVADAERLVDRVLEKIQELPVSFAQAEIASARVEFTDKSNGPSTLEQIFTWLARFDRDGDGLVHMSELRAELENGVQDADVMPRETAKFFESHWDLFRIVIGGARIVSGGPIAIEEYY